MIALDLFANPSMLLLMSVVLPLIGALLLPVFAHHPNWREAISLSSAGATLLIILQLMDVFQSEGRPYITLWELIPGFAFALSLKPLGMIFALVAAILWPITTLYAIGYMRGNKEPKQTAFFMCFAVSIAATMGIAFSANLFTLFICYEVLTLCTYPLVTHKGNDAARLGGRTYLGILMGTSMGLLLPAILITWYVTGTLEFTRGGILGDALEPWQAGLLLALFMFGIGKAALMPFHRWLPAAMVAPTPVSALLHAVAVVKAGVFSVLMVVVYVFGFEYLQSVLAADYWSVGWLAYIAGATVLLASWVALRQDNLKRRLAYSTISQLSYVIMGAAVLAPLSLVGAIFHIAAHAVGKITLFFAAGSIYTASNKTLVSQLNGIGRAMPWTMGAFAVASLSMIGIPPTVGFVSKWYLLLGAMGTQHYFAVAVLVISTMLNAAYLLPIVYAAFFKTPDEGRITHGEAPKPIVIAITLTAFSCVALFFACNYVLGIAGDVMTVRELLHLP